MTFEKHIPGKQLREKYCEMCGDLIYTKATNLRFCGSQKKRVGCAYKVLLAANRRLYGMKSSANLTK